MLTRPVQQKELRLSPCVLLRENCEDLVPKIPVEERRRRTGIVSIWHRGFALLMPDTLIGMNSSLFSPS